MKDKTNTNTREDAIEMSFAMYKETVSPPREMLMNILDQIPEKEKVNELERRAIRSPYIWIAVTQLVSVFVIAFAVLPTLTEAPSYTSDPFYAIDTQVDQFEQGINNEDYQRLLAQDSM